MSIEADLHNFGRCVRRVNGASGSIFQKPRPVYWEWLFFGKTSPLATLFEMNGRSGRDPRSFLFNLETEVTENYSGHTAEVVASTPSANAAYAYSLGVLLGYCYVFGIRDLHRNNLIPTDTHLQVIDAEVVLVQLLLPNETLLLPFKEVGPALAAISHLGGELSGHSVDTITEVLRGYCDVFECFRNRAEVIREVFAAREIEMAQIPVRSILRDTVHYRNWQTARPNEAPFFREELTQLERGDIPYFFKFLNDSRLYSYIDRVGTFRPVEFPEYFAKAVARDACSPFTLLDEERVQRTLFPTGLLFLAKKLPPENFCGRILLGDLVLDIQGSRISFKANGREYVTDRAHSRK